MTPDNRHKPVRLLFPEPTENPISAQLEAVWMLLAALFVMAVGGILKTYNSAITDTTVGWMVLAVAIIFATRFASKARGWNV